MTHEHSLHGVIPGLLLLALLWERWAGYTWLALATLLTWLPKRAVRHDLGALPAMALQWEPDGRDDPRRADLCPLSDLAG
jgi:hypothetical protein